MALNPPSEDFKDMLEGESSLGLVFATDLFINKMPSSPDNVVSIHDASGESPEVNYTYEKPGVQIRVRGAKGGYKAAHEQAQDIRNFLHPTGNLTINGARYVGIWAEGDIIPLGDDDNERPLFSMNFRVHRTDT